ncbi:MAG: ribonuclease P protein component [Parcubacteria group bacterium CG2_30_36_18]|nr:MAG: ribonuclease P protein component [Parcubacteria group bacterium CG2_30_36_18]
MVPKKNRLQKKTEIVRVFKKGKGFKEDFLILKLVKNNLEKSRFSFIISQKVSKKATTRNKIKRRLSEIVRLKLKKIKKGIDVILIACPGLEEKDFWEIEESLDKLFLRANLYV